MKKIYLAFLTILTAFTLSSFFVKVEALDTYNVTITSYFDSENQVPVTLTNQNYAAKITASSSLSSLENYSFQFWVLNGVVRKDLPLSHTFTVTGTMDIIGVFAPSTSDAILFMDSNGDLIETLYTSTGSVTPTVDTSSYTKPNFIVDTDNKWDKPLTGITESDTRVLQYKIDTSAEFNLTVVEGTKITTPNGTNGKYIFNNTVEVEANAPRTGEIFSHWLVNGQEVSRNSTYHIGVVADTTLTAVYVKSDVTLATSPLISIRDVLLRTSKKSYVAQMYIPEGHTLIDYGFLRSTTSNDNLAFSDTDRIRMEKYYGPTNEFLATFASEPKAIKAYMVTETSSGLVYTLSDQINYGFTGLGTLENPYQVATISQLQAINSNLTAAYELTADLDLTGYDYGGDSLGWTPIGDTLNRFTGSFNGNGHYIKGLMINRPTLDNVGLFGHIGVSDTSSPTTIKNIVLIDFNIIGQRGTGSVVGRVTGNAFTLIENVGAINGTVKGTGASGGLVGSNNSFTTTGAADRNPVINKGFSVGVLVYGEDQDSLRTYEKFGVLVGCSQKGTVRNSYSIGEVIIQNNTRTAERVGGLIGCNIYRGFLTDSYAASKVTAALAAPKGALIGRTDSQSGSYSPIEDAYYNSSINGTLPAIGEGTTAPGAILVGLTTSNMQGTAAQTNMTAFDWTNIWVTSSAYPILQGTARFMDFQKYAQGLITFEEISS